MKFEDVKIGMRVRIREDAVLDDSFSRWQGIREIVGGEFTVTKADPLVDGQFRLDGRAEEWSAIKPDWFDPVYPAAPPVPSHQFKKCDYVRIVDALPPGFRPDECPHGMIVTWNCLLARRLQGKIFRVSATCDSIGGSGESAVNLEASGDSIGFSTIHTSWIEKWTPRAGDLVTLCNPDGLAGLAFEDEKRSMEGRVLKIRAILPYHLTDMVAATVDRADGERLTGDCFPVDCLRPLCYGEKLDGPVSSAPVKDTVYYKPQSMSLRIEHPGDIDFGVRTDGQLYFKQHTFETTPPQDPIPVCEPKSFELDIRSPSRWKIEWKNGVLNALELGDLVPYTLIDTPSGLLHIPPGSSLKTQDGLYLHNTGDKSVMLRFSKSMDPPPNPARSEILKARAIRFGARFGAGVSLMAWLWWEVMQVLARPYEAVRGLFVVVAFVAVWGSLLISHRAALELEKVTNSPTITVTHIAPSTTTATTTKATNKPEIW